MSGAVFVAALVRIRGALSYIFVLSSQSSSVTDVVSMTTFALADSAFSISLFVGCLSWPWPPGCFEFFRLACPVKTV